MRAIRVFRRNIANAFKSIFRNFSLSVASIICTTITLTIVSVAMIAAANVNEFIDEISSTLTIDVYIDKNASEEDVEAIKSRILEIRNIKSDEIIYKDKETIRKEMLESNKDNNPLLSIMENWTSDTNILESKFELSVKDVTELEATASTIKTIENVTLVQYSENVLEKMLPVFEVVRTVTLVIIIGLVLVTVLLICNTIKLTIFARKNEIEIMRLVGTSNFVIKLPFVIEGLFLGIIGSIIPVVVTIWGYALTFDKLGGRFMTKYFYLIEALPFTLYISGILIAIGAIVGMFGSYITVRRHLKI